MSRTIIVVAIMHLLWGVCLLLDPHIGATSSFDLVHAIGGYPAAVVFAGAALLALLSLGKVSRAAFLLLIFPQQALIVAAVIPISIAIINGQYRDGTTIPGHADSLFGMLSSRGSIAIALDQLIYIVLAVFHSMSVVRIARHRES